MRFSKYHGTGNDFVMVEDLADRIQLNPTLIAGLCDRRRGVGADGLIRIAPANDADFFMDYYNAEGAPAEMCGNGIRCLAKYVYERGLTDRTELDVLTRAGVKHLLLEASDGSVNAVTVDMGAPAFERKAIPMGGDPVASFIGEPFEVDDRTYTSTALSMGNPHLILFHPADEDLGALDVGRIGPLLEHHVLFPHRTNVEFVKVADGRIHVRVWERGVGETMACGTGACAALVACSVAGLTAREAELVFPGGTMRVAWGDDDHVWLTGPAVSVYDGELDEAWVASVGTTEGAAVDGPIR